MTRRTRKRFVSIGLLVLLIIATLFSWNRLTREAVYVCDVEDIKVEIRPVSRDQHRTELNVTVRSTSNRIPLYIEILSECDHLVPWEERLKRFVPWSKSPIIRNSHSQVRFSMGLPRDVDFNDRAALSQYRVMSGDTPIPNSVEATLQCEIYMLGADTPLKCTLSRILIP
ncbi:MAG: hypothetical protein ACRC8S_21300 [Fimbriiglobus sp.]